MNKLLNCAPLFAVLVGGLAVAEPASAHSLSLSSATLTADNVTMKATLLKGDSMVVAAPSNQQRQQIQQKRNVNGGEDGIVYAVPLAGFAI